MAGLRIGAQHTILLVIFPVIQPVKAARVLDSHQRPSRESHWLCEADSREVWFHDCADGLIDSKVGCLLHMRPGLKVHWL